LSIAKKKNLAVFHDSEDSNGDLPTKDSHSQTIKEVYLINNCQEKYVTAFHDSEEEAMHIQVDPS